MIDKEQNYAEVIKKLSKKDLILDDITHTVYILQDSKNIGIKSWGLIDFLTKVHNYKVIKTLILPTKKELEIKKKEFIKIDKKENI
jgi:hypothetical protein